MSLTHLLTLAVVSRIVVGRTYHGFGDYPMHRHPDFHYPGWGHKPTDWSSFPWNSQESNEENSWEDDKFRNHRSTSTSTTTKTIEIRTTITNGSVTSLGLGSDLRQQPTTMDILMCLRTCPVRPEYRPVCGTDNMTYSNPSRLQCAMNCGVDVALLRPGPCSGSEQRPATSTNRSVNTTRSPAAIQNCIRSCPVTSEYNPVCGTDSVTYDNPGRLECARDCGKSVSLLRPSRCQLPEPAQDPNIASNNATSTTSGRPVTNPVVPSSTDTTPTSFTPTRFTNVFIPTNSPLQTNTNNNRPSTNGLDFSIPQNLLDNIFNNLTTTEDTPDYSFDERFE
ncbi:uncharacterized protein ACR2FA_000961 [Aphomia sociella]